MGRFAKNKAIHTGSYAIGLPQGSNTFGPQFPVPGQIRYNIDIKNLEVFYDGSWHEMSLSGRVDIIKDSFVGDGNIVDFTMSQHYKPQEVASILVFVGNIFQEPGVSYTVNDDSIVFTSAPDFGMTIVVLHNFNSTHVV